MNSVKKSRVLAFLGAVALVSIAACADSSTEPQVTGVRAARDTTTGYIAGDTLQCRSGWTIEGGRYVCN